MPSLSTRFSHLELNVSDYRRSIRFYDTVLLPLGFKRLVCTKDFTAYLHGQTKLILCPTGPRFLDQPFHRKRSGLNHLAFYAESREQVDHFHAQTLVPQGIPTLYSQGPSGDNDYYAVYFEDPDRIKLELVYAPHYCDPTRWPNNLASDFDPYA